MNMNTLTRILSQVESGEIPVNKAAETLKNFTHEQMEYASIDHHRSLRKGFPEVIYGEGKTTAQIIGIMEKMAVQEEVILVTRIDREKADAVTAHFSDARFHEDCRMLILAKSPVPVTGKGTILVVSAGTSDIPVAKEALITAEAMGNTVQSVFDVGVAGIHRLFEHRKAMANASVIIVVAGMEGALPSVVAGLVKCPVIAVPTSIGYGVSMNGLTALFSMLNSCSSNVAVVNIDNGFGAGYMASSINNT